MYTEQPRHTEDKCQLGRNMPHGGGDTPNLRASMRDGGNNTADVPGRCADVSGCTAKEERDPKRGKKNA